MKAPRNRGTPISDRRFEVWLDHFAGFRDAPTRQRIERWLELFRPQHTDLAARVLDCVEVISNQHIRSAFRRILANLPGWHDEEEERNGRWIFVARETSAGESGGSMLHLFRSATGMSMSKFNKLFRYVRDLPGLNLGPEDNVVFVDDFSGTGNQICNNWLTMKELLPGQPNIYLVLIAVPENTVQRIEDNTDCRVFFDISLSERDNIFSPQCHYFNNQEKNELITFCRKADRKRPRGFGDCGLLIVFHHGCPNNSIPVLHKNSRHWAGLFPAHDFVGRE